MNKILVITVTEDARGSLTMGGLDTDSERGIREALSMTEFARSQLTEALVQLRVREMANEQANATPPVEP